MSEIYAPIIEEIDYSQAEEIGLFQEGQFQNSGESPLMMEGYVDMYVSEAELARREQATLRRGFEEENQELLRQHLPDGEVTGYENVNTFVPPTYVPEFDRQMWQELLLMREVNPHEYALRKAVLEDFIGVQIETFVRERISAELTGYEAIIQDGELFAEVNGTLVPIREMMERGIAYRSNLSDGETHRRELSELEGFSQIEAESDAPAGTMWLVFSPPGRGYPHNFFDVFRKKVQQDGQEVIDVHRYSTDMSLREILDARFMIKYGRPAPELEDDQIPGAAYHLGRPIKIEDQEAFPNTDTLFRYIHRERPGLTASEFLWVKHEIVPFIKRYNDILENNPLDRESHTVLNAIMNVADAVTDEVHSGVYEGRNNWDMTDMAEFSDIDYWGRQVKVREVMTECGISGEFMMEQQQPYSVVEFGWTYDKSGICRGPCKRTFREGGLGPCLICSDCEKLFTLNPNLQVSENLENQVVKNVVRKKSDRKRNTKKVEFDLLVKIKRSIPIEKKGNIIKPDVVEQPSGIRIGLFDHSREETRPQDKKAHDKMTMLQYAKQ